MTGGSLLELASPPRPTVCARESELPFRAGRTLGPETFAQIRRRALLDGCKWDPQVGDVSTLARFPLLLSSKVWNELASTAEQLTTETFLAEAEVLRRPNLLKRLGIPLKIRRTLQSARGAWTPPAARVMRFDFHFTSDGWRISEVNSDVPGGFTEASFFTTLMAEHYPFTRMAGNPAAVWADSIAHAAGPRGTVALLSAPGFMEDHQVLGYLGRLLRARGCQTHMANPAQVKWNDGVAKLQTDWFSGPVNAIVRFYQAEWLPKVRGYRDWPYLFCGGRTPVGNPGMAIVSESKRFPRLWDELETPLPTWRRLLPETRDPQNAPWLKDESWIVKSALSNTADDVCLRELMTKRNWTRLRWEVRMCPRHWIAQRRFRSMPLETADGPSHVCLGVYTINGKAAGIYGRLSSRPLIDYAAVDVAVLIQDQ